MTAARAVLCPAPRWRPIVGLAVGALAAGSASAQFESGRNSPTTDSGFSVVPTMPEPIYFPPNPPPLGRPVSRLSSTSTGQTLTPPPELGAYVTEPFYAPLSTRLVRHDLTEKQRQKLDAYLAARDTLLAELQGELTRVALAPPAERLVAFTALAHRQADRLSALDAAADDFRDDVTKGDYDWSALREWRIGRRNTRGDSPIELAAVMRAYAFYQAGCSRDQRLLLREIVIELVSGAEDATVAAAQQPYLFFSPALTRVTLPDTLPTDLGLKVAAYETKKSALKKQLFDLILAEDGSTFSFTRTAAIRNLSDKQAPALAELEQLADSIRAGLVSVPEMTPKEGRSPLPPLLTERTMAVVEARTALHRTTREKVDVIVAELPADFPVALVTSIDPEGVKVRFAPRAGARRRPMSSNSPLITGVVARINEVGEAHRLAYRELARTVEDLRGDVGRVLGANATTKQIDQALDETIRFNLRRENAEAYHEYRLAVFEPGLAPTQRRILLGSAMRKLDLPLPDGELQPTRRPDNW